MLLGKLLSQFFYLLFQGFALLNLGLKGWYIIGRDILLPSLAMLRPTVVEIFFTLYLRSYRLIMRM